MGWHVSICRTLLLAGHCLKRFLCTQSSMLSYIGWHAIFHRMTCYPMQNIVGGNCLKCVLMYSKWHVILCGTLIFAGNWNNFWWSQSAKSSYIGLHVILCRTSCFCWKLSERDFNALKVAYHPMKDYMSSYVELYYFTGMKQILMHSNWHVILHRMTCHHM